MRIFWQLSISGWDEATVIAYRGIGRSPLRNWRGSILNTADGRCKPALPIPAGDPRRRSTAAAIQALLRQGLHVHYYSSSRGAAAFGAALGSEEARCFHLHAPISDQSALVAEISRYHAGWFVTDLTSFARLGDFFLNEFARELANDFVATTVSTASILYGCAGLPSFFENGFYTARLFPAGTAIEISHNDAPNVVEIISQRDWQAMRQAAYAERGNFSANTQIDRLAVWLDQFHRSTDLSKPE